MVFLAPLLGPLGLHLSLLFPIQLVPKQHEREGLGIIWSCMLYKAIFPLAEVFEAFDIGNVVDKGTAVSPSVEGVAKALELFLASGVPDLQSHDGVVDHHFLLREVSPDRRLRITLRLSTQVLLEKSGLSNAGVSQDDNFEEVLLFGRHSNS
eukprot:CAMPEP_0170555946 /NCGR_PEP_ID=MMETSP0211-20121228/14814_1 /TAXON_ID=311385 /ORGANISM="Pseudokeronopsis sp., Strain OXSARD2" /LENGTH=151 /DNA_ID=CAMNT_0010865989 /DNA_START=264 /DNA_END=715 /DNA_ORIENTATION=-